MKFDAVKAENAEVMAGEAFPISKIFAAAEDMAGSIKDANVKVFASPVVEGTQVSAVFTPSNTENWEDGSITFSGEGKIAVTITDYYYCTATTVILNVVEAYTRTVSFSVPNGVEAVANLTGSTNAAVTLPSAGVPAAEDDKTYVFAGWVTAPISEENVTDTAPTTIYAAGSKIYPAEDTKLYALYTYDVTTGGSEATTEYVLTDLADIKSTDIVVITMTNATATYALPDNGTSTPPATKVTVDGTKLTGVIADKLLWNISKDSDNYMTIYPNGTTEKWLYSTNSNNGVRCGTKKTLGF